MPVSDWLVQPLRMEKGQGTGHLGWGLTLLWSVCPAPGILPIPEALVLDSALDGFHSIQCPGRWVLLRAVAQQRRREVGEASRERLTDFHSAVGNASSTGCTRHPSTQKAVLFSRILFNVNLSSQREVS